MLSTREDLVKLIPAPTKDTSEPPANIKQYIMKQIEKQLSLTIQSQLGSMLSKVAGPAAASGASVGSKSTLA